MVDHQWFDADTNEEYADSISEVMYNHYKKDCKDIGIKPSCNKNDFDSIINELETSYRTLKERAELENEQDPIINYVLEEDELGALIVIEVHFKEEGQFDVFLMSFSDKKC